MAVNSLHPEYTNNIPDWQLMRATVDGDVRAYVPKLEGLDTKEHEAYINRPSFYNATARTLDALTGLIYSKPPEFTAPADLMKLCENITLKGNTLEDFAKTLTREVFEVGRVGVLLDMPSIDRSQLSRAEEEAMNIRTYASMYKAESIINWKVETNNGIDKLVQVVLEESYLVDKNEFEREYKTRYRVLDLIEVKTQDNIKLAYRQRLFIVDNLTTTQISDDITPKVNGSFLDYIPFYFFGINENNATINKPPMLDLATVNISHFKNWCDLEHGAHFTALPTACFWGYQPAENEIIKIGSTTVNCFNDPSGHGEYLEFKGDGLDTIVNITAIKEKQMAVLGARLLLDEKKTAEATETVAMRSSGERAVLITAAVTMSSGMQKLLEVIAEWEKIAGSIVFNLNTDYNLTTMDAQLLQQLMTGVQTSTVPLSVLYHNMQQGELIPEDMTYENYQGEIETAQPQLSVTSSTQTKTDNG